MSMDTNLNTHHMFSSISFLFLHYSKYIATIQRSYASQKKSPGSKHWHHVYFSSSSRDVTHIIYTHIYIYIYIYLFIYLWTRVFLSHWFILWFQMVHFLILNQLCYDHVEKQEYKCLTSMLYVSNSCFSFSLTIWDILFFPFWVSRSAVDCNWQN